MLTSLRNQTWFVLLMVFAIGWSSVTFASAKPMHQQMISELMLQHKHSMPMTTMSGCHDSVSTQAHTSQHSAEHLTAPSEQDCYQTMMDQQQHFSCNDCVQLHCQSLILWLDSETIAFLNLNNIQQHPQHNFNYSAQHLTGFWQQILRPPKA
ncbi:hypothetical protein E0H80_11600 [Acinetobacter sp. ANC 4779]|uniref:hypothetical protein n=1 Tax=Acinetobacter sp. ANC 4779 TaxID=2529848 RepID=UPI00103E932D|nr:hypothetical protein [Acinetobacter sp. ANC 4779]TCB49628.1 hypothetical protein E0H80_11600 [Acinetobacter sp. ANC 4779]